MMMPYDGDSSNNTFTTPKGSNSRNNTTTTTTTTAVTKRKKITIKKRGNGKGKKKKRKRDQFDEDDGFDRGGFDKEASDTLRHYIQRFGHTAVVNQLDRINLFNAEESDKKRKMERRLEKTVLQFGNIVIPGGDAGDAIITSIYEFLDPDSLSKFALTSIFKQYDVKTSARTYSSMQSEVFSRFKLMIYWIGIFKEICPIGPEKVPKFQMICLSGNTISEFFSFHSLIPELQNEPLESCINEQGAHRFFSHGMQDNFLGNKWTALSAYLYINDGEYYWKKNVLALLAREELKVTLRTDKEWNALHFYVIRYSDKTDPNLAILDKLINHKSATIEFLNHLNTIGDTPLDVAYKVAPEPFNFTKDTDGTSYYTTHDTNNDENSSTDTNAGESSRQKIIEMLRAKGCKRSSEL